MRHTVFVCIAILMTAIVGCSSKNTPMPSFILSAMLQGDWLVETMDANKEWTPLGTFVIDGNNYRFDAMPDVEAPVWMRERFCFIGQPVGQVVFEYEHGVSPDDDIRLFENNDILLKVRINCGETFLIRADQDRKELYWHSGFSELQLYLVNKSYTD